MLFLFNFDNFGEVFGCSLVTKCTSKMLAFSVVSSSWVIIFYCLIDFDKLEKFLGCLTPTVKGNGVT